MKIEISPKEYERRLNWNDAIFYCQLLVIDDKIDWRLPTKEELNFIFNSENDFKGECYWSSTKGDGHGVWAQYMDTGTRHSSYGPFIIFYFRPVRTLT